MSVGHPFPCRGRSGRGSLGDKRSVCRQSMSAWVMLDRETPHAACDWL